MHSIDPSQIDFTLSIMYHVDRVKIALHVYGFLRLGLPLTIHQENIHTPSSKSFLYCDYYYCDWVKQIHNSR